jgi:hypothetical protein
VWTAFSSNERFQSRKRRILLAAAEQEDQPRELALSEALVVRWSEEFATILREAREYAERRGEYIAATRRSRAESQ